MNQDHKFRVQWAIPMVLVLGIGVALANWGGAREGGGPNSGGTVSTATAPLVVTGADVACTAASASSGGCLTRQAPWLVLDAGLVLEPGPLHVGFRGFNTDGGFVTSQASGQMAISLLSGAHIRWSTTTGGLYADGSGILTYTDTDGV